MSSVNEQHAFNLGCDLAVDADGGTKPKDSVTILDFGGPREVGSDWGASLFGGADQPVLQIRQAAQQFGLGFYACSSLTPTAKIAIGTSNDFLSSWGSTKQHNHGQAWGQMINNANSWASDQGITSQVSFAGASDMELGFASPGATRDWVHGFKDGVNAWNLFDYGDAAGCSQTAGNFDACGTSSYPSWDSGDVYWISWGSGVSNPAPEIYTETGSQASQWFRLSKYSINQAGDSAMNFVTALSQRAACGGGCSGTNNSPAQSWNQLYDAIHPGETADDIRWSSNIKWD